MSPVLLPILAFLLAALAVAVGMLLLAVVLGPRRKGAVKAMPYESGMDPIHDARRRFDVRFHLVAVAFLLFDVEVIFLYPWAVAHKHEQGLSAVRTADGLPFSLLVLLEVLVFVALLAAGLVYVWRKGLFRWR
jgi:NADH-quinone oxidoreductase subunit A